MVFVTLGTVTAWFLFLLGLALALAGFATLFALVPVQLSEAVATLLDGRTTEQAIDRGLLLVGLGIALGVLCQIARNTAPSRSE